MFETIFRNESLSLSVSQSLMDRLWNEISSRYSRHGRYYHNLSHLDKLGEELIPVQKWIQDWQTVVFSIAWHDVVYNTLRQDNEEKSARFASDQLAELGIASSKKEKCEQQILATKSHRSSDDMDTNYFTDADLSILGYDISSYMEYARQIRKEYRFYPDIIYKAGRRKVLEKFLDMETIFKTDHFRNKFEEQARTNLSAELKRI